MDRTIVILATESKIVFYLSALSQSQHRNYVTLRAVYYTMVNNREVFYVISRIIEAVYETGAGYFMRRVRIMRSWRSDQQPPS